MNSKKFLFGLCSVLALAGCSSDDALDTADSTISDGTPRYLTVNISNTPSNGTRANDAAYEDGEGKENEVEKVRFYFFSDDGTASAIKSNGSNYYDWTPADTSKNQSGFAPNIEETLSATIVINTSEGDKIPSKILAIVNPDEAKLPSGNTIALDDLRRNYSDNYLTAANNGKFVMVSSVYATKTGERIATSNISASNLETTAEKAWWNPVNVYVERNVAKVNVQFEDGVLTDGKVALKDSKGNDVKANGGQVYFKPIGWNLTATTTQAYLSKQINPAWRSSLFAGTDWNNPTYFRSFWAFNVNSNATSGDDIAGQEYFNFNKFTTAIDKESVVYTNENAATTFSTGMQRTWPTQVVVAGELVDAKGDAINLIDYAGETFLSESDLITRMLNFLTLYKKTTDDDGVHFTKVTANDVQLVTAMEKDKFYSGKTTSELETQEKTGRYYVELSLESTLRQKVLNGEVELYLTDSDPSAAAATVAQVKSALSAAGHAKVWKSGKTYYSFKVRHLADENEGMYGIVRNHTYKITIDGVVGLGTPVYNPEETIYPETPVDEDTYIAAKINILSWRLVNSTTTLGK